MWLPYYSLAAEAATASNLSSGEILQTILSAINLGVLGVVFWLFVRGQLHSSDEMNHERGSREKAEEQRDEALRFARDQIAPLLSDFTNATSALLPILQGLVTRLEITGREDSRDWDSRRGGR